jgi:hypothetical protein
MRLRTSADQEAIARLCLNALLRASYSLYFLIFYFQKIITIKKSAA